MNSKSHKCALLLIDLQNDFMPGGPLAIPGGDEVLPIIDELLHYRYDLIVATKDWHPENHGSFAATHGKVAGEEVMLEGLLQRLWAVHCIQNTYGADYADGWRSDKVDVTIHKGENENVDSYSAFFDNGRRSKTPLDNLLHQAHIQILFIAGVATDYCVKFSVLDACRLGFTVFVITDACRGVNVHDNDVEKAFDAMQHAGATLIKSADISSYI